jgi:hypothetical protein
MNGERDENVNLGTKLLTPSLLFDSGKETLLRIDRYRILKSKNGDAQV